MEPLAEFLYIAPGRWLRLAPESVSENPIRMAKTLAPLLRKQK
jgi:hypothetical protein